jgi:predicted RNA-binding Zn-ribbon protein involved in translation (DUF1610 family)
MRIRSVHNYPFKLRVFEDGRIKSKGFDFVSKAVYAKYIDSLKTCLDCNTKLIEYVPYKYRCPNCGETYSWGFSTLSRDKRFYENHPEYAGPSGESIKNIPKPAKDAKKDKKVLKSSEIGETYRSTHELLQKNLSIDEIASARGLTKGTIVEHIVKLLEKDFQINIDGFISKEKQNEIIAAYSLIKPQKLKELKDYLGDNYSYDDIRLVLGTLHKEEVK